MYVRVSAIPPQDSCRILAGFLQDFVPSIP